jgi:hypothetical protein
MATTRTRARLSSTGSGSIASSGRSSLSSEGAVASGGGSGSGSSGSCRAMAAPPRPHRQEEGLPFAGQGSRNDSCRVSFYPHLHPQQQQQQQQQRMPQRSYEVSLPTRRRASRMDAPIASSSHDGPAYVSTASTSFSYPSVSAGAAMASYGRGSGAFGREEEEEQQQWEEEAMRSSSNYYNYYNNGDPQCAATAAAATASSSPSSTSPRSVVALTSCGEDSSATAPCSPPPPFDPPFGAAGRGRDCSYAWNGHNAATAPLSSSFAQAKRCDDAHDDEDDKNRRRAPIEIEIEPGLYSVLRGSDETWEAILEDMYMPSQCPWCQITVFAIQDCGYVLCPECKAVFPAEEENTTNTGGSMMINRVASGVGLGFTFESLRKWQPEVNECRRQRLLEKREYDGAGGR